MIAHRLAAFAALLVVSQLTAPPLLAAPQTKADPKAKTDAKTDARAEVKGPKATGTVTFQKLGEGSKVVAEFKGLQPGAVHGFHVHQNGACEGPDFKSAGEHFNPSNAPHGGPSATERHIGDFGNVVADTNIARKELALNDLRLDGDASVVGKAVILHSKPDDLATQPSGEAGDRIACGVIRR